jgi:M6 family metalloprotease-like protein
MSARWLFASALAVGLWLVPQSGSAQGDLSDFKTVDTAVTTKIKKTSLKQAGSPGYLGVAIAVQCDERIALSDVEPSSPAAKAGLQTGDVVTKIDGQAVRNADAFRSLLQVKSAGDAVQIAVQRKGKPMELTVNLTGTSRAMQAGQQRAVIGVTIDENQDGDGAALKTVASGAAADKAGLKAGDVILKIDGRPIAGAVKLNDILIDYRPGDNVTALVKAKGKDEPAEVKLTLAAETANPFTGKKGKGGKGGGGGGVPATGWDTRNLHTFKRDTYKLAVIGIDYPDVKHNDKVASKDWEEALFSSKVYNKTSVTGQKVYGSMNDYYQEQSFGKLKIEGKAFDYVTVSKKRSEYAAANTGTAKSALLTEAIDKLMARDGKKCLDGFDGIFFMYAGARVQTNRGGIYWPHRSTITHQGKRLNYFIVQEGGGKMCDISVICHEFGHLLGLPDLYARPENPGSEGVGVWCAMSNQAPLGKPQHFSAWSKEQLGWITPAVIDPTVKQKLILSPIEDSPKECFKVLARPDGSEYFLLEHRRKKGFDASLPAEGLLIWRVIHNRPILEESHGVEGPSGPRTFLNSVPFPSGANNAFTPYTTPSSRAQMGGGLPVHITNIRRLPDGRVTFFVGYEYY